MVNPRPNIRAIHLTGGLVRAASRRAARSQEPDEPEERRDPPRTRAGRAAAPAVPARRTAAPEAPARRQAASTDTGDGDVLPYEGSIEEGETQVLALLKRGKRITQSYRGREFIHVSDVINKCIRKIAIMEMLEQRHPREVVWDGQGVTYAIGHAIGDYVVQRFATAHPDKVWAEWGCACGVTKRRGIMSRLSSIRCPECNTHLTKHHEVPFIDEDWQVTGSPDIVLYIDEQNAYHIVELKSMTANMFNDLARPLPDHKVQVSFYWQILHRLGWPLVDRCSILYVNKEFSFRLPYKEYLVDPNEPGLLTPYMADIDNFVNFRETGELPPRTFCSSIDITSAKSCPVCVTCFGCNK